MEKVRPETGREAGLGHGRERPLCRDAPVSRRPWMAGSDHCAGMHRCRGGHGWPGATTSGHHYSQLLTTNLNFPALTDCVLSGASDGCPRFILTQAALKAGRHGASILNFSLRDISVQVNYASDIHAGHLSSNHLRGEGATSGEMAVPALPGKRLYRRWLAKIL